MISVLILDINEAKENETKENVSKETVSKKLHTCPLPQAEDRDPRLFLLRKGLHFMGADSLAERLTSKMLCLGRDGKPSFSEEITGKTGIFFNLSHSGNYLAGAFSDREIGLDIQTTSPPHSDVLRIARRFFPLDEYELLAAIKDRENQLELFFRLWSIKEAYLKYCGCGLRADLNSFLIRPVPQIPSMQDKKQDTQDKGMDTAEKIQKGNLSVLKKEDLLSPAEYALLSGPPGYTLAVCAETIPDRIQILYI